MDSQTLRRSIPDESEDQLSASILAHRILGIVTVGDTVQVLRDEPRFRTGEAAKESSQSAFLSIIPAVSRTTV